MGKSAAAKQQITEYYMSIHGGICHGPVDAITGLFVGEKLAWQGEVASEAAVYVNAPSLFGGPKDGGGVGGIMYFLPGTRTQVMPDALAQRQGLTSNTSPAYRGVASVYFVGTDDVPVGVIDTSGQTGGDGGTTSGGSGGGGPGDDGPPEVGGDGNYEGDCVAASAWLPDGRPAAAARYGDTLLALDYVTMTGTTEVDVIGARLAVEPCVTITTESGITLTVSRSTPVTLDTGEMLCVMDCVGERVPVQDENGFRWETVARLTLADPQQVVRLNAGGATYAAGDQVGRYIFTHNLRKI